MSLHRLLAVIAIFLLSCGRAMADDAGATKTLSEIPLFAFGGIGAAGITSHGEAAFRSVFAAESAEADFQRILKTGTPQAQCYSLVGLRIKNRPAYDEQVKRFATSKQPVDTCAGCMPATLPMSSVVAGIERGYYDERAKLKSDKRH